jgi:predicted metal-binding membrane protein
MQKATMSETAGHDFGHLPPAAAGLGHIFARPKLLAGLCVILLVGLGWFYLALLLAGSGGSFKGFGVDFLALCGPLPDGSWSATGVAIVASMWGAMTLAMMLPSAAPMIMTYAGIADTAARKNEYIVSPFVLAAGYMTVWTGFSVVAALAQIMLTQATLLNTSMTSASGLFSGAIFIGAGLYQFSALKHACLNRCQQPFPFFFANWVTTTRGVLRLGLKQGVFCLGCCWAMMLVMFAVGIMNVIWMVGIGMVMTIEKMLNGRRFTHAVGLTLIVAGVSIVLLAVAAHWPVRTS